MEVTVTGGIEGATAASRARRARSAGCRRRGSVLRRPAVFPGLIRLQAAFRTVPDLEFEQARLHQRGRIWRATRLGWCMETQRASSAAVVHSRRRQMSRMRARSTSWWGRSLRARTRRYSTLGRPLRSGGAGFGGAGSGGGSGCGSGCGAGRGSGCGAGGGSGGGSGGASGWGSGGRSGCGTGGRSGDGSGRGGSSGSALGEGRGGGMAPGVSAGFGVS